MVNIRKYKNPSETINLEDIINLVNETSSASYQNSKAGYEQGAFFAGFISPMQKSGFSDEMLTTILISKMTLDYQLEINRMKFETDEKLAEIYSISPRFLEE